MSDPAAGGDGGPDLAALDMEGVKREYVRMRQEQRRAEVYQQNLARDMQKLKQDLDVRTEEVESLQRTLLLERRKGDDQNLSLLRESEFKAKGQDERIRDSLSDILYAARPDPAQNDYQLETVVVTFKRRDCFRYDLAFRVDALTTVRELRGSACRYWGVKEGGYILRTQSSNKCQDGILVKECFKQGEIAQLLLEEKKHDPHIKPTDDEMKAIQPKVKRNKKMARGARYDEAAVSNVQQQHDSHASELRKMGGVYFLLKTRNMKPSEHVSKIKLRDIVIYSVLIVVTVVGYCIRRPGNEEYWLIRGFSDQLLGPAGRENDWVGNRDDLWRWLEETVPSNLLWSENHPDDLRAHNAFLGYAALRIQNVRQPASPGEGCEFNADIVKALSGQGAACYEKEIHGGSAEKSDLVALGTYWDAKLAEESSDQVSARLRGPSTPWRWRNAEENWEDHGISPLMGQLQTYDGSGYMSEYNMNAPNKTDQFKSDLVKFRELGMISSRTRAIVVSFSAYNFDCDRWVSADVLFELPPSGDVRASLVINVFKPKITETQIEMLMTHGDYVRLTIAFYIAVFVGMNERNHKIKNHKAGCWYHVSYNGICDLGIVGCIAIATVWRAAVLTSGSTAEHMERLLDREGKNGFRSFTTTASAYKNIFCVEGLLMAFLMHRTLSFLRLNRTVYLLWHTLGKGLRALFFFAFIFLPTIAGFTIIVHAVYGPYLTNYATMVTTILHVYKLIDGELDITPMVRLDMAWAMLVLVLFYVVINFLILNIFLTIIVEAYYTVMLTSGTPGESWSAIKRARWVLPGIVVSLCQSLAPPTASEAG